MSMSRADAIRRLLTLVGAGIAAACAGSADSSPSDGGIDAIGSDGGDGSTGPITATVAPEEPQSAQPVDEPDAGVPPETLTPDEAYYTARDFNTGATAYVYNSGTGALTSLPETLTYSAVLRIQQPSGTQPSGRLFVLERNGSADVDYQANVMGLERNEEGVWANAWVDRGDGTALLGSIIGGRMILGRRTGNLDMACRSFTDGDWCYFTLPNYGEVIAMDVDNAGGDYGENYIVVAENGCMAPTADVEAEDMIFVVAEAEDGTGRVCVINPSSDLVETDEAIPLETSRPRKVVKAGSKLLIASPGSLDDFSAPGIRGVELFDSVTWEPGGVLWNSMTLCADIESCSDAYPLHISVDESLGIGAVTLVIPTEDPTALDYSVRLFSFDEAGNFELGTEILRQSRTGGSDGGIEGTAFLNGAVILITHRLGVDEYDITTDELRSVAGVDDDGRYPAQAAEALRAN